MDGVILYCSICGVEGNEHFTPSKVAKFKKPGRKSNFCKSCQREQDEKRRKVKLAVALEDKTLICRNCDREGGIELFNVARFKIASKYCTCKDCRRKQQKKNMNYKIRKNMSNRIKSALANLANGKKDYGTMTKYVGCSISEFKIYIENQFTSGMNWDNYGEWHMDHIRPLASFDLTDQKDIDIAFNYTNIQPLWANDNLTKSSFYNGIMY
ncbi:MAG: hypothetical protein GY787_21430 [Alteromonadales bacterium]|nr:hypothetical protein [Alteromonadales bacterium]